MRRGAGRRAAPAPWQPSCSRARSSTAVPMRSPRPARAPSIAKILARLLSPDPTAATPMTGRSPAIMRCITTQPRRALRLPRIAPRASRARPQSRRRMHALSTHASSFWTGAPPPRACPRLGPGALPPPLPRGLVQDAVQAHLEPGRGILGRRLRRPLSEPLARRGRPALAPRLSTPNGGPSLQRPIRAAAAAFRFRSAASAGPL